MDNIINKQMDILDDKLISLKEICNQQPATQNVEKVSRLWGRKGQLDPLGLLQ